MERCEQMKACVLQTKAKQMNQSIKARENDFKRTSATKPKAFRPRDLPMVLRLLEAGNDEFQIAHVLGISVEELLDASHNNQALKNALDNRDEIRLWDGPRNIMIARQLAARGYGEIELVEALCASPRTIFRWRLKYPEFDAALEMTKEVRILAVERTLLKVATGYVSEETRIQNTKEGLKKVRELKVVRPDKQAKAFFLSANEANKYGTVPRSGQRIEDDPLDGISELLSRGLGTVTPVERDQG
jgi:hypothetical protein